jgi:hypothetical protein
MPRTTARIALLLALLAGLPAGSAALADGPGPSGQFLPSVGDRDGDGLPDAADCAPDDPSRPARAGVDLDCDGADDGGGLTGVGISGPVDGGPDPGPGEQTAASRPSTGSVSAKAAARRAVGEAVVAVRGLRLGPSIAVYAPARAAGTLIFVAKDNSGVTVRPSVVRHGKRHPLRVRTRSVSRGHAWVVRVHPSGVRRVRFAMRVVDSAGAAHRATRAVPVS